eukprot:CAMPEP_0116012318 /NCGR_PEP_ID=MMETSP0321-20121206/5057_1 /TAXON_ID=163516 /ORGANISM="Leptocylindrus danicus var. danicus, Strain B650" /LENGTH=269 /DNA_ID=CAMNT_0003481649 /DNA_START=29 /DNA_END=839 /DNA_ORIENTATION=-
MTNDWDAAGNDFTGVRETHNDDLPLHMAIYRRAPDNFCDTLIEAYPSAARIKGREGYLPLHWACQVGASLAVVEALIVEYPSALDVATSPSAKRPSMTPRALARANLNLRLDVKDAVTQGTSLWVRFSAIEKARRDQAEKVNRLETKLTEMEEGFTDAVLQLESRFKTYEEDTKALLGKLMQTIRKTNEEQEQEMEEIKDELALQKSHQNVSRTANRQYSEDLRMLFESGDSKIRFQERKYDELEERVKEMEKLTISLKPKNGGGLFGS